MYSKYDEAQFHLRLPHELHAKIKQRAKMNNRSLSRYHESNLSTHASISWSASDTIASSR